MPAPARTSLDEIVAAGQEIVEAGGLDSLTMQKVAAAVGVKAPSLYKHVTNRGELIRLIVEAVLDDLGRALEASVTGEDAKEDLVSLAGAFRRFAHNHPETYRTAFAPMPEEWSPEPSAFRAAADAVLRTSASLAGEEHALEAARLVTAWAHGFMTMELSGAFRIGGDLERAFEFGIEHLADALST